MKNFFVFLLVFILLIGIVKAEEAAKYNFGSMQADKELNMAPGETAITKLYFYNIYGNRITHVSLSVGEAPENWGISFEPLLHETMVSISGVPTTIEENLYVEPSEAVEEIPATVPEGIEYISSPVGYIGAKPVKVKIKVPANEKFGKYKVTINALAEWLGQAGSVAFKQSRSFDYTVTVASKEFTEEITPLVKAPVKETVEEEEKEEVELVKAETEEPITGAAVQEPSSMPINAILVVSVPVIALLLIIIVLLVILVKKKK